MIPLSEAIFFASGEANIRCPSVAEEVSTGVACTFGASVLAASFLGSSFVAAEGFAFKTAFTSVPSGPITANKESTGAPSPS